MASSQARAVPQTGLRLLEPARPRGSTPITLWRLKSLELRSIADASVRSASLSKQPLAVAHLGEVNGRVGIERGAGLGRCQCFVETLSRESLFVATIILVTHPTRGSLTKDRDPSASQVENRLAESGTDPMSPPLGATSGNFELDAIHRSGVSVDRRTWLLEHHVPSGGYFSQPGGPVAKNWRLRVG